MFWCCPACRSEIRHNLADVLPAPHTRYRCHVCRLDLRFDPVTEQMEVAPFDTEDAIDLRPPNQRVIPPPATDAGKRSKGAG